MLHDSSESDLLSFVIPSCIYVCLVLRLKYGSDQPLQLKDPRTLSATYISGKQETNLTLTKYSHSVTICPQAPPKGLSYVVEMAS